MRIRMVVILIIIFHRKYYERTFTHQESPNTCESSNTLALHFHFTILPVDNLLFLLHIYLIFFFLMDVKLVWFSDVTLQRTDYSGANGFYVVIVVKPNNLGCLVPDVLQPAGNISLRRKTVSISVTETIPSQFNAFSFFHNNSSS